MLYFVNALYKHAAFYEMTLSDSRLESANCTKLDKIEAKKRIIEILINSARSSVRILFFFYNPFFGKLASQFLSIVRIWIRLMKNILELSLARLVCIMYKKESELMRQNLYSDIYHSQRETCPAVILNGLKIPQVKDAKYLGLHLGRRLNWRKHIHIFTRENNLEFN